MADGYTQQMDDILDNEVMKAEFDDKVKYMCYGDTIMITYTHKVFQSDINEVTNPDRQSAWDGESVDEAQ